MPALRSYREMYQNNLVVNDLITSTCTKFHRNRTKISIRETIDKLKSNPYKCLTKLYTRLIADHASFCHWVFLFRLSFWYKNFCSQNISVLLNNSRLLSYQRFHINMKSFVHNSKHICLPEFFGLGTNVDKFIVHLIALQFTVPVQSSFYNI